MDLISKDDTKTHKKSREESLVWTYGLQHTLNRVESNYYLPATYIVPYSIKCIIDFEKRETFAHTHTKETQNFFFFASFEEYKALFSTERPIGGRR